ncbi:MAG: C45 family autoproteolytic acyltransferase/hydrolase [bacterium]|nr:C45 family autoproteolytic acyltransferase/hydrolase [bacterium]
MPLPELEIDLSRTPAARWQGLLPYRGAIHELFAAHFRELADASDFAGELEGFARRFLSSELRAELAAVAEISGHETGDVLLLNLYYDAIKAVLGCSAFAVDSPNDGGHSGASGEAPGGPLHARNLDWYSEGDMLRKHSMLCRFTGGRNEFVTIGWPGFIGALSGMAPGKFAVTLNAVLSIEEAQLAAPISFLIREVLESAESFDAAVARLADDAIYSDCLLLVTGPRPGEMVVIERTPGCSALRRRDPKEATLAVTNSYRTPELRVLAPGAGESATPGGLADTADLRYDRVQALCAQRVPANARECFAVLDDSGVRMPGTMQQMVFRVATGALECPEF